ncbi:hypothetical protein QUW15_08630, partial [Desulfovibrio piger]|nr:hypothetical protein [Desulfovibrio piger]
DRPPEGHGAAFSGFFFETLIPLERRPRYPFFSPAPHVLEALSPQKFYDWVRGLFFSPIAFSV